MALAMLVTAAPAAFAFPYRFVTHEAGFVDYWPRISPDGAAILFSRCKVATGCGGASTTGHWDLYKVPFKGGQAQKFVAMKDNSATRSNWSWNTDLTSGQIAFSDGGLFLVNDNGSALTRVPTPASLGSFGYPSFFPNGLSVTVNGQGPADSGPVISDIDLATGEVILQLTDDTVVWTGESAVSRVGTEIAFAAQLPFPGQMYDDENNQVWIESLTGLDGDPPALTDPNLHQLDPLQGRTPDWSPNDAFLSFESRRACVDGDYAIFIEASVGGEAVQATDCKLDANHAVWTPDGRHIVFSAAIARNLKGLCTNGCRGIAVAPVPEKIRRLGTAK